MIERERSWEKFDILAASGKLKENALKLICMADEH